MVASVRWPKRPTATTLPTDTPEIRTSAPRVMFGASSERDLEPVALRLERHRPAELDPEEQDQAEARERERQRREDRAAAHLTRPHRPALRPARNCSIGVSLRCLPEAVTRRRAPRHEQAARHRAVGVLGSRRPSSRCGRTTRSSRGSPPRNRAGCTPPRSPPGRAARTRCAGPARRARGAGWRSRCRCETGWLSRRKGRSWASVGFALSSIPWVARSAPGSSLRALGERVQRGGQAARQALGATQAGARRRERARQQLQRLAQRAVLARERPQGRVGAAHHAAQVALARARGARHQRQVAHHAADLRAGARPGSR